MNRGSMWIFGLPVQGEIRQNTVTLVEAWANLDVLPAHLKFTPHMAAYREAAKDYVQNVRCIAAAGVAAGRSGRVQAVWQQKRPVKSKKDFGHDPIGRCWFRIPSIKFGKM